MRAISHGWVWHVFSKAHVYTVLNKVICLSSGVVLQAQKQIPGHMVMPGKIGEMLSRPKCPRRAVPLLSACLGPSDSEPIAQCSQHQEPSRIRIGKTCTSDSHRTPWLLFLGNTFFRENFLCMLLCIFKTKSPTIHHSNRLYKIVCKAPLAEMGQWML